MTKGRQSERAGAKWAGASALALALTWTPLGQAEAQRFAFDQVVRSQLDALAVQAGLEDAAGSLRTSQPLTVEVVHEGGQPWMGQALRECVDEHRAFVVGASPHLVRAEVLSTRDATALLLRLDRRGWSLKPPEPSVVAVRPHVLGTAMLGAFAMAWWTRRIALALLVFGLGAQGMAFATQPNVPVVATKPFIAAWREDGALEALSRWAAALPDAAPAFGWALVALCVVGMILDHVRSRGRGGATLASVPLGVLGLGLAFDAAVRTQQAAYVATVPGALVMISAVTTAVAALLLRNASRSASLRNE